MQHQAPDTEIRKSDSSRSKSIVEGKISSVLFCHRRKFVFCAKNRVCKILDYQRVLVQSLPAHFLGKFMARADIGFIHESPKVSNEEKFLRKTKDFLIAGRQGVRVALVVLRACVHIEINVFCCKSRRRRNWKGKYPIPVFAICLPKKKQLKCWKFRN